MHLKPGKIMKGIKQDVQCLLKSNSRYPEIILHCIFLNIGSTGKFYKKM
jgi:hypothetical protein